MFHICQPVGKTAVEQQAHAFIGPQKPSYSFHRDQELCPTQARVGCADALVKLTQAYRLPASQKHTKNCPHCRIRLLSVEQPVAHPQSTISPNRPFVHSNPPAFVAYDAKCSVGYRWQSAAVPRRPT
ncbi:hypothetical protein Tsp_01421 [Trichinella spiralis]|uniref:hypothetical protein n=1 Tax=Trichinella spiralis TaxID=6334 RepID=UPI0001EFB4D9|nr:hypothetical protein Tsp_01421 [Trichinella spiralis]